MVETFLITLEQMVRVLLLLFIGFVFNKLHLISKTAEQVLSRFVTLLFLPCLMLYSNIMECRVDSLAANAGLVILGTVFCLVSMAISYPLGKFLGGKDEYQRGVFRYALTFPNTGAFATPLMLAFYGTSGFFQYNLFYFVPGILCYTWGIMQLQVSHGKNSIRDSLKKCLNPVTIITLVSLLLGVLGAKDWIPDIVLQTTGDLGDGYVVVGLLLTGFTIADYPLGQVFRNMRIWIFTLLRLVVIPVVFTGVGILCGAPLMTCVLIVLVYAGPCGMNPAIFASVYGEDCEVGVGMILISSVLSGITIPVLYALVQHFVV